MTAAEQSPDDRPRTDVERDIADLWAGVLGRSDIARSADFFDLGGDSLLALRMVARARKHFGVKIPARMVFDAPTLAAYSARVIEFVDG